MDGFYLATLVSLLGALVSLRLLDRLQTLHDLQVTYEAMTAYLWKKNEDAVLNAYVDALRNGIGVVDVGVEGETELAVIWRVE